MRQAVFKNKVFLLFVCLLGVSLLSSGQTFGQSFEASQLSAQVEKRVTDKIHKTLSVMLTKKDYILDVNVAVAERKPSSTRKKAIQINDNEKPQEDYLLFRKLGLEAPIESEPVIEKTETLVSLRSVAMTVFLKESLPAATKKSVKEILGVLNFNLSVKPKMDFQPLKLAEPKAEEKKEEGPKEPTLYEMASEFSTSLGFIISAFMLSIVSLLIFRSYSKLSERQSNAMLEVQKDAAAPAEAPAAAAAPAASEAAAGGGGGSGAFQGEMSNDMDINLKQGEQTQVSMSVAMKRFSAFMDDNHNEAISLIKRWIKLAPAGSPEALAVLAQELEPETLMKVFSSLEERERKLWKEALQRVAGANLDKGAVFLNNQVLEEIIVPTDLITDETKALLYALDPESCAKMIEENPDLGAVLMNTLATSFIVKMLPLLSKDIVERITMESTMLKKDEIKSKDQELRAKIQEYSTVDESLPFSDKISELLPHVDMETEDYYFKALAQTSSESQLTSMIKSFLPAKLIPQLEDKELKKILDRLPQTLLVNMLTVLEEDVSQKYLELVAPSGKKREMLDLEISNITSNELLHAKMKKNKAVTEREFISTVRNIVARDAEIQDEIEPMIKQLSEQYLADSAGGQSVAS